MFDWPCARGGEHGGEAGRGRHGAAQEQGPRLCRLQGGRHHGRRHDGRGKGGGLVGGEGERERKGRRREGGEQPGEDGDEAGGVGEFRSFEKRESDLEGSLYSCCSSSPCAASGAGLDERTRRGGVKDGGKCKIKIKVQQKPETPSSTKGERKQNNRVEPSFDNSFSTNQNAPDRWQQNHERL